MKLFTIMCCLLVVTISCDSEKAWECLQVEGDWVTTTKELPPFDHVVVEEGVAITVEQGVEHKASITTGAAILDNYDFQVVDEVLTVTNSSGCNLLRNYDAAQITITTPTLRVLQNASGFKISSNGVLAFPQLDLVSENFNSSDHASGDFDLQLEVAALRVTTNNLSNFYLSGTVENALLESYSGDGQLFCRDLIIENAQIFHRGTNNWQLDVRSSISGQILGYGDVILEQFPPQVTVDQTWYGRLIER